MSQEEYDNIKQMLTGRNYIGFCVRSSSKAKFSVVDQDGVFPDQNLYDLTSGNILQFDKSSRSWKTNGQKIGDKILDNVFLFSEETKRLVYYHGKNTDSDIIK